MKKSKLTKLLALLMAGMMTTSLVACGETDKDTSGDASGDNTSKTDKTDDFNMDGDIKLNKPGEYPLVDGEPVTFSAFISPHSDTSTEFDRDSNQATKYLEDKLNVRFDFDVAPKADKTAKLNVLFTTDDYPEILIGTSWDGAAIYTYGEAGYILPMDEYLEKDCYWLNEYIKWGQEEVQDGTITDAILDATVMPDGHTYSLYKFNPCLHTKYSQRMYINEDWLKAVDMEMPTTTDEFYDVLTAFDTKDPNGNGKADEVPLSGAIKAWNGNPRMFLMNSFGYYPGVQQFYSYVDNGKIVFAPTTDDYREGLEYLNKLSNDGLLPTDAWTQDIAGMKALVSLDQVGVVASGGHVTFTQIEEGVEGDWTKWKALDPLKGTTQYAHYTPAYPVSGFQITDNCKHPKLATRIGDTFYDTEVCFTLTMGAKDKYWRYAEEGEKGQNGEQSYITKIIASENVAEPNYNWSQNNHSSQKAGYHTGVTLTCDPEVSGEGTLYMAANSYSKYSPDEDIVLPPLIFDEDTSKKVLDLRTDLHDYIETSEVDFITKGITDEKWNDFQAQLKSRGYEELIGYYQDSYDLVK